MSRRIWGYLIAFGGVSGVIFLTNPVGGVGEDDQGVAVKLEELTRRLAELERAVGIEPGDSLAATVVSRLKTAEKEVADISKTVRGLKDSKPSDEVDELKRRTKDSARDTDQLERRLAAVEKDARQAADLAADLRAVKADVTSLDWELQNLARRVSALESKR